MPVITEHGLRRRRCGGATQVCAKDVPAVQTPDLSITKVGDGDELQRGRDVIHYTIVATNDGNMTLAAVTVTDPNA